MTLNLNIPSAVVESMANSLKRIADSLDLLSPPPILTREGNPPGPEEALVSRSDAHLAAEEAKKQRRTNLGLLPDHEDPDMDFLTTDVVGNDGRGFSV